MNKATTTDRLTKAATPDQEPAGFTLLASDPCAPASIREWARLAGIMGCHSAEAIAAAQAHAEAFQEWAQAPKA